MCKKKTRHVIEVVPVDDSPRGLEELRYTLEAVFAKVNSFTNDEELKEYLIKELARPREEVIRETRATIEEALRQFREKKDC
jgi:hypothetical protein